MPVIPLDVDDEVLYSFRKVYLSHDTSVTMQTRLDFWGPVFFNGSPIANIGAIPMATQAQAEAGIDNTTVMSPLRTQQAVTVQAKPAVLNGSGGGTSNYLRADGTWNTPAGGGGGVTDGDKGDIVVSGSGATWMLDSTVVTPAAKTILDDTSVTAIKTTLDVQNFTSSAASVSGLMSADRFVISGPVTPAANNHATQKAYVDGLIATVQPLDADLGVIAGLTATTDNVIQSVGSAWASRTPAQLKTSLALTKSDVGLGNVDNVSDANAPVSTAQAAAIALKADKLRTINTYSGTSLTAVVGDSGAYVRCTGTNPTYTLPTNATVSLPVGTQIDGVGTATAMTIVAAGGVTVNKPRTLVTLAADSGWTAIKVATDEWDVHGDFV